MKGKNGGTEQKNKISLMRYLKYKRKAVFVCEMRIYAHVREFLILVPTLVLEKMEGL